MATHTFRYTGRIERSKLEHLLEDIGFHQSSEIIIRSHGGFMEAALWFYDEVKKRDIRLKTVADAYIDSAAIIVFLAGTERIITPGTTMEFHGCVCEVASGSYSPERLVEIANAGVEAAKRLQQIVADATNNAVLLADVAALMVPATKLVSASIVKHGLAHKVESL